MVNLNKNRIKRVEGLGEMKELKEVYLRENEIRELLGME
jgi:Leucine-rich repeat (LRR) protein